MEESHGSGKNVDAFGPNAAMCTTFTHKYMSYLLPALLRVNDGNSTTQIQKIVRFEVDMALVLSADEFKWSRALKQKLGERAEASKCSRIEPDGHSRTPNRFVCLDQIQYVPRPIIIVKAAGPRKARGDDLDSLVRVFRRLLPGGCQMSLCELISEVESYVCCLKLQVNALKSLVNAQ